MGRIPGRKYIGHLQVLHPSGQLHGVGWPSGAGHSEPDKLVVHPRHYKPFVQEVARMSGKSPKVVDRILREGFFEVDERQGFSLSMLNIDGHRPNVERFFELKKK
jgi:hypothetical protein